MAPQQFRAQMDRLAAAYRVEVSTGTRAAYFLAFQKVKDVQFAAACERAIEHDKTFPSIAALKEILRHRGETERREAVALPAVSGTVQCLTCGDAGYVRRDVEAGHPDFGKDLPCPHCEGALKPRDHHAEYMFFLSREVTEMARLAPFREEQAARHKYAPVLSDDADLTPPPEGFARHVQESAERVPVPTCVTMFVITPKKKGGRRGFVAEWANAAERAARGSACEWRESRDAVRHSMANLFADIQEVKA